jgi:hypothetical protein
MKSSKKNRKVIRRGKIKQKLTQDRQLRMRLTTPAITDIVDRLGQRGRK